MDKACCANCKRFDIETGYCRLQQDWIGEKDQYITCCSFWKQDMNKDD